MCNPIHGVLYRIARRFNAGTMDAGTMDAETMDAWTMDAGTMDAGRDHRRKFLSRSALLITVIELNVMAPLAIMGLSRTSKNGYRTPAASGMPNILYMNAKNRFCRMLRIVPLLNRRARAMPRKSPLTSVIP